MGRAWWHTPVPSELGTLEVKTEDSEFKAGLCFKNNKWAQQTNKNPWNYQGYELARFGERTPALCTSPRGCSLKVPHSSAVTLGRLKTPKGSKQGSLTLVLLAGLSYQDRL